MDRKQKNKATILKFIKDFGKSSNRIRRTSRISRRDVILTLFPALLWPVLISLRPVTIDPRCAATPASCTEHSVPSLDRFALGQDSWKADLLSYYSQNTAGVLAGATPALLHFTRAALGRLSPALAMQIAATDFVIFFQTLAWNGLITESVRQVAQRPRPFVYQDPANLGQNSANYTSFYSGHTSFVAAITTYWVLTFLSRDVPFWMLLTSILSSQALIVITAMGRVLSGRHFASDVIAGAVAGALVGLGVTWIHRMRRRRDSEVES